MSSTEGLSGRRDKREETLLNVIRRINSSKCTVQCTTTRACTQLTDVFWQEGYSDEAAHAKSNANLATTNGR